MTYFVARNVTTGRGSKAFFTLVEAQGNLTDLCAAGDEYTITRYSAAGMAGFVEQGHFGR